MDSDDEIFLMQNTFSQEPFFPELVLGTNREPEKLVCVSFGEKNNLGGLKNRNVRQKRIEHYANDEEPAICLVRLNKKYLEKCPKTAVQGNNVFYLTPRQKYKSTDEGMIPINIDRVQEDKNVSQF